MRTARHSRQRGLGILTVAIMLLAASCSTKERDCAACDPDCEYDYPESNAHKVTITQGMWSDVWFYQGDFMPGCPTGTITPVAREMRIHELTNWDQVDHVPYREIFYSAIHTRLVATVYSDSTGFFQIELPPGTYSLFSVEDTLFYANGFDGSWNIHPVPVMEDQVTDAHFRITYKAAW